MNVYSKLQRCRVQLQSEPLKKSGKNTFAKYDYFELGDFMPTINRLFLDAKLCGVVSFSEATATLTIINTEKPEETIVFTSPMSTADLKGCHSVQNLGAVQTYLRRYLYVDALEIVEHDALDSTTGKTEEKRKPAQAPAQEDKTSTNANPNIPKAHTSLYMELAEMCGGDEAAMDTKLQEITKFTGKDGKESFMTLAALKSGKPSDKWVGATLGKLRKETAPVPVPCPECSKPLADNGRCSNLECPNGEPF